MQRQAINLQAHTSISRNRWRHWLMSSAIIALLLLAGCGKTSSSPGVTQKTLAGPIEMGSPFPTNIASIANEISTIDFTLRGGVAGTYMIHASLPTSKLRHGYREFTIDVADAAMSIYLAFYGYHGPGNYTLSEGLNGGDVRINFYQQGTSWDLSLRPKAQCTLTITSDTPTSYAGLDRMRGAFSCPLLPSSSPNHPQQAVVVSNGRFDVAIIAES